MDQVQSAYVEIMADTNAERIGGIFTPHFVLAAGEMFGPFPGYGAVVEALPGIFRGLK